MPYNSASTDESDGSTWARVPQITAAPPTPEKEDIARKGPSRRVISINRHVRQARGQVLRKSGPKHAGADNITAVYEVQVRGTSEVAKHTASELEVELARTMGQELGSKLNIRA